MSYPFVKALTWEELIEQMRRMGVSFKTLTADGPHGTPIKVTYFENKMDGKAFQIVVDITDKKQLLMPSTLRVICKALHIHPCLFGLDLG